MCGVNDYSNPWAFRIARACCSSVIEAKPHGCMLTLAVPDVEILNCLEYPLNSASGAITCIIY